MRVEHSSPAVFIHAYMDNGKVMTILKGEGGSEIVAALSPAEAQTLRTVLGDALETQRKEKQ